MVSGMVLLDWKVCCGNSIFTLTQSFTSQPHLQGQASQTNTKYPEYPGHKNIQDRKSRTWWYPGHGDIQDRRILQDRRISRTGEYPGQGAIQDGSISRTGVNPGNIQKRKISNIHGTGKNPVLISSTEIKNTFKIYL